MTSLKLNDAVPVLTKFTIGRQCKLAIEKENNILLFLDKNIDKVDIGKLSKYEFLKTFEMSENTATYWYSDLFHNATGTIVDIIAPKEKNENWIGYITVEHDDKTCLACKDIISNMIKILNTYPSKANFIGSKEGNEKTKKIVTYKKMESLAREYCEFLTKEIKIDVFSSITNINVKKLYDKNYSIVYHETENGEFCVDYIT